VLFGAILQFPLPLGEGQGEGHSCYDSAHSIAFETASSAPRLEAAILMVCAVRGDRLPKFIKAFIAANRNKVSYTKKRP
jgi:hypothetical protein